MTIEQNPSSQPAKEEESKKPLYVLPNGIAITDRNSLKEAIATLSSLEFELLIGPMSDRFLAISYRLGMQALQHPRRLFQYLKVAQESASGNLYDTISHFVDLEYFDGPLTQSRLLQLIDEEEEEAPVSIDINLFERPKQLAHFLGKTIIGQEEAIDIIATEAYHHYNAISKKTPHSSISMLVGRTGTGKTLLGKSLATYLNIPFVYIDATKLTKTGYVGESVSEFTEVLRKVVAHPSHASLGLIFIDEFDKIGQSDLGSVISAVQTELLTYLEGVPVTYPTRDGSITCNTGNFMYILSGSFERQRSLTKKAGIGFDATIEEKRQIEQWGIIPELLDRIRHTIYFNDLTCADLENILQLPTGPFLQFKTEMELLGKTVEIENQAYALIAEKSYQQTKSARGLQQIVNYIVDPLRFEGPDLPNPVTITAQDVIRLITNI